MGTNNGAITGFGNINGVLHTGDSASGNAANDLLNVYNQLNTTPATLSHAPMLGNGDTLVGGVYAITGNTTFNLNLVLDGKGSTNTVFIFKIQGTLSSGSGARVTLINGAVPCKVFWKVEGAVNLATGTIMKGTLIAHNAAISLGAGVNLEGRALSTTGAVFTNQILAYIPQGCGSPLLTGPVAPALKSADCFALFSGNGSLTNDNLTRITGDIGTNMGLTTGYDPLYVTGYIHPIPDEFTRDCAADLISVYNYLNTLPADIELLYPAQFGRNLVLTPHTYIMNGATTLTDSLYLDAEGNHNAVFIIKINGALSTSSFAKIYLSRGAQAKNVYWLVNGAIAVNDNSVFNGTIVCSGAIDLGSQVTLNGRALITSGDLSTNAIIGTSPSGNCNLLPLTWLYFRGRPALKGVWLEWGTASERNNAFFTVERSSNGNTFETLTTLNAAAQNGKTGHNYTFTDPRPHSISYYRISQTDKDGQKSTFRTIRVKVNINNDLKVTSFIQQKSILFQVSGAQPGNGIIELYGLDGKKMSSQEIVLTRDLNRYNVEAPLQKGIYVFKLLRYGQVHYYGKVLVQ